MIKYAHRLPPYAGLNLLSDQVVRKAVNCSMPTTLGFMEALLSHFVNHPDPLVVPIYDFKIIGKIKQGCYAYQYDMMRLGMIGQDQQLFIDQISSACYVRNELPSKSTLLCPKKKEKYSGLISFMDQVFDQNRYHDIHGGNFMIDLEENYRIIDLEGFQYEECNLKDPYFNWIKPCPLE